MRNKNFDSTFSVEQLSAKSTKSTPENRRLIESFEQLRSHPFGPGRVEMQKEARRFGVTPTAYKLKFQDWLGGAA
jgi:hypothetical protein